MAEAVDTWYNLNVRCDDILFAPCTAGVLNLFSAKYPRVIKHSTPTPRIAGEAVDFTLLHHNNARSGNIYMEFSIGMHFPLVQDIKK